MEYNNRHNRERLRILQAYQARSASEPDRSSFFGHESAAHVLRLQERYRVTLKLLTQNNLASLHNKQILDVGCGTGVQLLEYLQWDAQPELLSGIDMRKVCVEQCRKVLPDVEIRRGCATELPWPNQYFDIVSQQTVFSSILSDAMRTDVAQEMMRVLKPDGIILWYDNLRVNPNNRNVRAVSQQELGKLFPGFRYQKRFITFLPHIARRIPVAALEYCHPFLSSFPGCRTHLLVLMKRSETIPPSVIIYNI